MAGKIRSSLSNIVLGSYVIIIPLLLALIVSSVAEGKRSGKRWTKQATADGDDYQIVDTSSPVAVKPRESGVRTFRGCREVESHIEASLLDQLEDQYFAAIFPRRGKYGYRRGGVRLPLAPSARASQYLSGR